MDDESHIASDRGLGGRLAALRLDEHTFMVLAGAVVGVVGGYGAVALHHLIHAMQHLAWGDGGILEAVTARPWWWVVGIAVLGGAIVGPFVHFLAREAKGHGVPEVMAAVALNNGLIRVRVGIVKTLASAMTIAVGGSVGREGPIVQIGAAFGSAVGQALKVSGRRLRTLVGCGAAAGIAAAFNAPIAGALFAVEIVLGNFAVSAFSPIVIASVVATVVARVHIGDDPFLAVPDYGMGHPIELISYAVLGLVAAVVAVSFVKILYAAEDVADRIPLPPWSLTPIGFGIVGLIGLGVPEIYGVGYEAMQAALHGEIGLQTLALLLVVKIVATSLTIASGGSGGVFAPSLFLGAATGGVVGLIAEAIIPQSTGPAGAYALVGMGAVVAAATHAPLTAILIIFELTYDYSLIVPLMAACILATLVSQRLDTANIYTHKLLRRGIDLAAGREVNVLRSLKVREVMENAAARVHPSTHLGEIVDRATTEGVAYFYVTDDQGRLLGVIGTPEMRNALVDAETLRDIVVADDLARNDVPAVLPDHDLDRVMRIFGGKNREELPVIEDTKTRRFLGTITRGHLLEAYNRELRKRDMVSEIAGGLATSRADAVYLGENHWMKQVDVPGTFVGRTLKELDLRGRLGVQVVMLRRKREGSTSDSRIELVPGPDTRLELGDLVVAVGPREAVDRLEGR